MRVIALIDDQAKLHPGLKKNVQVRPGGEWLELLCKHILDRNETGLARVASPPSRR